MKRSNRLVIRLLAFALFAAGLAISQDKSPQPTAKEASRSANAWMAVPTPYTAHDEEIVQSVRAERDRFWDAGSEETPLTPERAATTSVSEGVWFGPQPEIPDVQNRAILIATFTKHRSILSASGRSVYTEVTLYVEDVFQDETGSGRPFAHQNITLLLPGGAVVMRSGQPLYYLTQPREVFLQPDKKYLLVLSYHSGGDFYTLGEDWDLSGGIVRPNTLRGQLVGREGRSSLSGLRTDQLAPALYQQLHANH